MNMFGHLKLEKKLHIDLNSIKIENKFDNYHLFSLFAKDTHLFIYKHSQNKCTYSYSKCDRPNIDKIYKRQITWVLPDYVQTIYNV